jgi:hypothetical protein
VGQREPRHDSPAAATRRSTHVHARNEFGYTPASIAAQKDLPEVVAIFREFESPA